MKKKIAMLASVIMLIAAAPVWAASDDSGQTRPGPGYCYQDENGRQVCPGPGQGQGQNQTGCWHRGQGNCWRQ